jgi:uncharacterized protein (TIRG00374 family)
MNNPDKHIVFSWKIMLWGPAVFFLWWALGEAPLNEIGALLATLDLPSVLFLVTLNIVILLGFSSRWKTILHALGIDVPLIKLTAFRLAGFAISYFTPGTQFGGEPIQAYLLTRNHPIQSDDAVSSIYLDKLIEILVNYTVLFVGLVITLENGLFRARLSPLVELLIGLISLSPILYFFLLNRGVKPATRLICFFAQKFPGSKFLLNAGYFVRRSENRIRQLVRQSPGLLFRTIGISLTVWVLMILEFHLMWRMLGQPTRLLETIITLTMARVAFLTPLPGGIGALEASQVLAMRILGYDPLFGMAACLWIRGRDITFAALGFFIANFEIQTEKNKI